MPRRLRLVIACILLSVRPASGQTFTAAADFLFYGDNSEFANPFRKGETLLGTAGRIFFDIRLNDTVTLRGGLFANARYGAHRFVEEGEPMIALQLSRGSSRFIFGSLETAATAAESLGPDMETPHGLLPPLQRETLTFARANEMGLQWLVQGGRLQHDAWIQWQRLNTMAHRERFDAGYRSRTRLGHGVALHGQWHVVHEGGQRFASGPVSDSQAAALGIEYQQRARARTLTFDTHAVLTREVSDRERASEGETGWGMFGRAALDQRAWRAHVILWRSRHTLKQEGDANYLMLRRDGTRLWKPRDYGEIGVTRRFTPAPGVRIAASARLHRVESHYEYSYRIVARVSLRHAF